jgi:hypothetical protein
LLGEIVNARQVTGIAIAMGGLLAFVVVHQRGDRGRQKQAQQVEVIAEPAGGAPV